MSGSQHFEQMDENVLTVIQKLSTENRKRKKPHPITPPTILNEYVSSYVRSKLRTTLSLAQSIRHSLRRLEMSSGFIRKVDNKNSQRKKTTYELTDLGIKKLAQMANEAHRAKQTLKKEIAPLSPDETEGLGFDVHFVHIKILELTQKFQGAKGVETSKAKITARAKRGGITGSEKLDTSFSQLLSVGAIKNKRERPVNPTSQFAITEKGKRILATLNSPKAREATL